MAAAASAADFDAAGRLTSVSRDGTTLPILAGFVIDLEGKKSLIVSPSKSVRLERNGDTWHGTVKLPHGAASLDVEWTDIPGKLRFKGALRAAGRKPLPIAGVDFVIDVPRAPFSGGQVLAVQPQDGQRYLPPKRLPTEAAPGSLLRENTWGLSFLDARKNWSVGIQMPEPRDVSVDDLSRDGKEGAYRVRIRLHDGPLPPGAEVPFAFTLSVVGATTPSGRQPAPN